MQSRPRFTYGSSTTFTIQKWRIVLLTQWHGLYWMPKKMLKGNVMRLDTIFFSSSGPILNRKKKTVATVPAPVLKLEYRCRRREWFPGMSDSPVSHALVCVHPLWQESRRGYIYRRCTYSCDRGQDSWPSKIKSWPVDQWRRQGGACGFSCTQSIQLCTHTESANLGVAGI